MCGTARVPRDLTTTRSDGEMIWADSTADFCFGTDFGAGSGSGFCCWITRVSAVRYVSTWQRGLAYRSKFLRRRLWRWVGFHVFSRNLGCRRRGKVGEVVVGEKEV